MKKLIILAILLASSLSFAHEERSINYICIERTHFCICKNSMLLRVDIQNTVKIETFLEDIQTNCKSQMQAHPACKLSQ